MCYLYSYYLRINRNHSSVIKKYTILQWFIYPPPHPTPKHTHTHPSEINDHVVLMRVNSLAQVTVSVHLW